jgi:hypothetical protein
MYCSQKEGEDLAKFCGLLRIYELEQLTPHSLLNNQNKNNCGAHISNFDINEFS